MKNFTKELKAILKEDPGAPIMSPDVVIKRANTMVILTNQAPPKLLALAGSSRKAILLNYKPLMITFPDQKGVYQVKPEDIVFENHHTGRDVTEAGSEETDYEKFFASAMKKFGVSSPIELNPDDTKKFFNYVDKNWEAEEESDGSKSEGGWEDPPRLGGEPSLITPMEGNDNEDANEAVKVVPYTYWNKASDGKRAKLLQLAKPGISTKWAKVDYESLTPMLKKAIDKVFKTKKAQIEIAPAVAAAASGVARGAAKLGAKVSGGDKDEDVSTGKVGKKDKGSYERAYKLALKKYKIHSADELDTPAERKGFTAYVDRLWKGGEVHESGCPCPSCAVSENSMSEAPQKSKMQRDKERIKKQKQKQKAQQQNKKKDAATALRKEREKEKELKRKLEVAKKEKAEREKEKAEREKEKAEREREQSQNKPKPDNDDNGNGDDEKDGKDKKDKKGSFLGGLKKVSSAAQSQVKKYSVATT